jgi:hypothetical protein
VLFSSDTVANTINAVFEPVWESVRPVPIVTIDFGNGTTITRTLHGNIATYLCDARGTVYDVLPGIYEPNEYLKQLNQFAMLYRHARQQFSPPPSAGADRDELMKALAAHADRRLKAYHERQAARLRENQPPDVLGVNLLGGLGKAAIEIPIELIAAGEAEKLGKLGYAGFAGAATPPGVVPPPGVPTKVDEIAGWKELVEDTRINESVRRRAIHEKLAASGRVTPDAIKKWLFKEVLAADLDDPTLGIGKLLDNRYPFAEEDAAARKRGK